MFNLNGIIENEETLDPYDWDNMEVLAHNMVKDMFDYLKNIRQRPVWIEPNNESINKIKLNTQDTPEEIETIYSQFKESILPYAKGNIHPRYWAWVEGTGTPFAMMGEMLAAGMNSNGNNGNHIAMYVEEQVINWIKQSLNYSKDAGGTLVSGGSMANLTGLLIARNSFNSKVRTDGINELNKKLIIYASSETHSCIIKAAEVMGLGSNAVRLIKVNEKFQISIKDLKKSINEDKKSGFTPFCIVGNVGTVKTGAIDPINEILSICKKENLWFHIDGAFGALAKILPEYDKYLKAIEEADTIAFDLHKWMYIPYGVGCILIKDKNKQRETFAIETDYLAVHERGLASGPDPLSNFGIEMSRGFKSLKVWMSIKEHGLTKFRKLIRQNIEQAQYLAALIKEQPLLELMAEVPLNVVCFRFKPNEKINIDTLNLLNKEIVMLLHEKGNAAPSYAIINGNYVIRVANVNHRSKKEDFQFLIKEVIHIGKALWYSDNFNENGF